MLQRVIIGVRRRRHEIKPVVAHRDNGLINIPARAGDVLNPFAPVCVQEFLDLAFFVGAFIDRDANPAARARHGARAQARHLAFYVEVSNLTKIKDALIPRRERVHAAAPNVVSQIVESGQPHAWRTRIALSDPSKINIPDRTLIAVSVDKIDERTPDAFDGGNIQLHRANAEGDRLGAQETARRIALAASTTRNRCSKPTDRGLSGIRRRSCEAPRSAHNSLPPADTASRPWSDDARQRQSPSSRTARRVARDRGERIRQIQSVCSHRIFGGRSSAAKRRVHEQAYTALADLLFKYCVPDPVKGP